MPSYRPSRCLLCPDHAIQAKEVFAIDIDGLTIVVLKEISIDFAASPISTQKINFFRKTIESPRALMQLDIVLNFKIVFTQAPTHPEINLNAENLFSMKFKVSS